MEKNAPRKAYTCHLSFPLHLTSHPGFGFTFLFSLSSFQTLPPPPLLSVRSVLTRGRSCDPSLVQWAKRQLAKGKILGIADDGASIMKLVNLPDIVHCSALYSWTTDWQPKDLFCSNQLSKILTTRRDNKFAYVNRITTMSKHPWINTSLKGPLTFLLAAYTMNFHFDYYFVHGRKDVM